MKTQPFLRSGDLIKQQEIKILQVIQEEDGGEGLTHANTDANAHSAAAERIVSAAERRGRGRAERIPWPCGGPRASDLGSSSAPVSAPTEAASTTFPKALRFRGSIDHSAANVLSYQGKQGEDGWREGRMDGGWMSQR